MANPDTEAISAMGTYLRRNGVEIAEVTNIGGPSMSAEVIDATHLRSPGMWREKIGGVKDAGELTFDLNFIIANATHNAATGMLSAFAGSTAPPTDDYDIVFPDAAATVWSFRGFVSDFETGAEVDGKLEASLTVTLSGAPTLA